MYVNVKSLPQMAVEGWGKSAFYLIFIDPEPTPPASSASAIGDADDHFLTFRIVEPELSPLGTRSRDELVSAG